MPESSEVSPSITMLVSRISARGKAESEGREAVRILRNAGWDVRVRLTDKNDDLPQTVREQPSGLIGAVGGDGYLAAVAAGLAGNAKQIMLPFPGGRGNDLCRSLGLGTSSAERAAGLGTGDPEELAQRIRGLDGMWVECGDAPEPQLALGVISIGLDATGNQIANRSWLRSGPLAYAWGGIGAFVIHKFNQVSGTVDGEARDLSGWISSISNTGRIGGGIKLVSESDSSDGLLEVFNVAKLSRWRVLPLLAKALGRGDLDSPYINLYQGTHITVEAEVPMPAMADGDLLGHTPLDVRIDPGVVRVLV